jgi:GH24 family phage-related lysozyme (muramidase)
LKDVKRWEGDHQFMYLDTRGYVTTGIGHLLKNADAAVDLPWRHRSTGQPATQAEVRAAFNNLKQMWTDHRQDHPKGPNPFTAEHYERKSDLVLPERLSETLALARLQKEFLGGLRRIFPGFDQYPTPAQRALVDMAYNLGVGKLERSFPNLVDACRAGDFDVAAAESRRTSSRANRNAETRDLFLQADQLKTSIRTFSREVRP